MPKEKVSKKSSRGGQRKRAPRKKVPSTPPPPANYGDTTDPTKVEGPVDDAVHESLKNAWGISKDLNMWFIFDALSPARRFKRGVEDTGGVDFADYGQPPYGDMTETDGEGCMWIQYKPPIIECVHAIYLELGCVLTTKITSSRQKYRFSCTINPTTFMEWQEGELRTFEIGTRRKKRNKSGTDITWNEYSVPAPYDRVIAQLITEDEHAKTHHGHEAVRRQSYAKEVLDAFGREITNYEGPDVSFRSKVLTPILQRQLRGVADAYGPTVRDAIMDGDEGDPSIRKVTEFYLSDDPTDPGFIPTYRRNLVYIPEARWHLGVVMKKNAVGSSYGYNKIRKDTDKIIEGLGSEDDDDDDDDDEDGERDIPKFTRAEVGVIYFENLEEFFGRELSLVVRVLLLTWLPLLIDGSHSPSWSKRP
jgi:hypothetical protein